MTRLQLARLVRFTIKPSKEEMSKAYYVVDNKAVNPMYRMYNLLQLRQFSKERLVEMIVDYLLDDPVLRGVFLDEVVRLMVAEFLLSKETSLTCRAIGRKLGTATSYESFPTWARKAGMVNISGALSDIREQMASEEYKDLFNRNSPLMNINLRFLLS